MSILERGSPLQVGLLYVSILLGSDVKRGIVNLRLFLLLYVHF